MKFLRTTSTRIPWPGRILAVLVALALVSTVVAWWAAERSMVRVTAYFTNSVGLYPGDRVALRGVPVGEIEEVTPIGDRVRVVLHFDADHPVAADTHAVIVAPTLVSGRYVQLTSKRSGDAELADGAVIPLERTAVPMEYDEVKRQVTDLASQLGPKDGSETGTLTRFTDATAKALQGNGATLNETLVNLSKAMQTLADGGPDLFGTVRNLQVVVSALAANDDQVQVFVNQLAGVSHLLNDNRTQLAAAMQSLQAMMPEVQAFVADNRDALVKNVAALTTITQLLVDREDDIASILHLAPTAIANFYNIYDPDSHSLTGNLALPDFPDPVSLICALLTTVNAPQQECSRASANFGDLFGSAARAAMGGGAPAPAPGQVSGIPGLPPGLPAIPGLSDLLIPGAGR
ncbi:MCE family protein [Nocardia sp. NPDC057663]|uniref:MCE family protein n=1 Tax=Nocardia sp. NPDC057663 TaxID=3346201 RepID=UPI00366C6866